MVHSIPNDFKTVILVISTELTDNHTCNHTQTHRHTDLQTYAHRHGVTFTKQICKRALKKKTMELRRVVKNTKRNENIHHRSTNKPQVLVAKKK